MEATTTATTSIPVSKPSGANAFALKNFKWKKSYWFYAGGAVVASYGIAWLINQRSMLDKTCFKPAGFVPNKLGINDTDINIKLNMKNKSDVDYYITKQIYNVFINDNFVGVIRNDNEQYILPNKTSPLWLNVRFNPLKVANISWDTLTTVLSKGGDAKIQIKGNAKVRKGIFSFNYPVDSTFTLKELTATGGSEPC